MVPLFKINKQTIFPHVTTVLELLITWERDISDKDGKFVRGVKLKPPLRLTCRVSKSRGRGDTRPC